MSAELVPIAEILVLVAIGLVAATVVVWLAGQRSRSSPSRSDEIVFLFDGDRLIDATDPAKRILDLSDPAPCELQRLFALTAGLFPGLRSAENNLATGMAVTLSASDGSCSIALERNAQGLRMRFGPRQDEAAPDDVVLRFAQDRIRDVSRFASALPFPIWAEDEDRNVTWANACYTRFQDEVEPNEVSNLFPTLPPASHGVTKCCREKLQLTNEVDPRWFEFKGASIGREVVIAGLPIDRTVQAERSLKDFVQAMTQTFAHLNVGLAVFARNRELAVFNPALSTLLQLSPEYLIKRPTLFEVFDQLRERKLIPEPPDYKSWRQKLAELEAAAVDGDYCETWPLFDGRTFRLTGRPHPDGAVAFVFEDISAEITDRQQMRTELQVMRSVVDSVDDAIAVFLPSGALTMLNRAYRELWGDTNDEVTRDISIVEASSLWQSKCVPTPIWGEARDFVTGSLERDDWTTDVALLDGKTLSVRFEALPGGDTLIGFKEQSSGAMRKRIFSAPQLTDVTPPRFGTSRKSA